MLDIIYFGGFIPMHCWRSYHVHKRYQFYRLFIISTMVSTMVFIMLYLVTLPVATVPLTDQNFIVFFIALLLLYPVHKLFHLIPFLSQRNKNLIFKLELYFFIIPFLDVKVKEPVSKKRFTLGLLLPFFAINIPLLFCIFTFPEYIHYVTILLAFHVGICFVDLIYVKAILSSPKNSFIEENEEGYEILIQETDIHSN